MINMNKLKIIIGGFIGLLPAGGVTWDYLQYPLGFHLMGHDVYYIEDTRLYPVYQAGENQWNDSSILVEKLSKIMNDFGLHNRWAYRDEASGKSFGLSESGIKDICSTADIFINISCSTFLRDEYLKIPIRILIDSDPMFTQIQYLTLQSFTPGKSGIREQVNAHNYLFTFGENIGSIECRIPDCGLNWLPTRQPICLQYWLPTNKLNGIPNFSTVMNWSSGKTLTYDNETWGQKNIEFKKIVDLPELITDVNFSIIVNDSFALNSKEHYEQISGKGWQILAAEKYAADYKMYRQTIYASTGEFSVAKETYVKSFSGWFSCRSACYLAAGKPVVAQDTGWSKFLDTGAGLLAFTNLEEAFSSVENILSDYNRHSMAARSIAEEYFDSDTVLTKMLSHIK
jgi:hypothetical protein